MQTPFQILKSDNTESHKGVVAHKTSVCRVDEGFVFRFAREECAQIKGNMANSA